MLAKMTISMSMKTRSWDGRDGTPRAVCVLADLAESVVFFQKSVGADADRCHFPVLIEEPKDSVAWATRVI